MGAASPLQILDGTEEAASVLRRAQKVSSFSQRFVLGIAKRFHSAPLQRISSVALGSSSAPVREVPDRVVRCGNHDEGHAHEGEGALPKRAIVAHTLTEEAEFARSGVADKRQEHHRQNCHYGKAQ